MNAPLGIKCQLQLAGYIVLCCGLESRNQPALILHKGVKLQVLIYLPEQMRAGVTLCSTTGQEQGTGFNIAIAKLDARLAGQMIRAPTLIAAPVAPCGISKQESLVCVCIMIFNAVIEECPAMVHAHELG